MRTLLFCLLFSIVANANLLGKKAPDFKLTNQVGEEIELKAYKGKLVVLEWLNHGCPFVKKHYNSGNMQKLQKKYTGKDVVWLSIISSAEGKQGHSTREQAAEEKKSKGSAASMVLLDTKGEAGKKYDAKTTPHMFVIDKNGIVAYEGAIDSIASTDTSDIAKADNYIAQALDAMMEGREVKVKKSKPYGCSVKY